MKNSTLDLSRVAPASPLLGAESWPAARDRPRPLTERSETFLPRREQWSELLGLDDAGAVETILQRALVEPIADLTSVRGKRVRAQLVVFGYRLLLGDALPSPVSERRCCLAAEAVEFLHAGSLIVDDIEDGSTTRRSQPALHLRYSMPIALNAGNWLYFWPFDLFKEVAATQDQLLHIYESCHRILLRAHFGQAIDLGAKISCVNQEQVTELCLASMRLKTVALMGFASLLGAAVARTPNALLPILDDFGRDLGVALQMFDDLGNVIGKCQPAKRYEDLMLSRPSWFWANAAMHCTPLDYQKFLASVRRLPDNCEL